MSYAEDNDYLEQDEAAEEFLRNREGDYEEPTVGRDRNEWRHEAAEWQRLK